MIVKPALVAAIRYVLKEKAVNAIARVTAMPHGGTHLEVCHNGEDPFDGSSTDDVEQRLLDGGAAWAKARVEHLNNVPVRMHITAIFPQGLTEVMAALRHSETKAQEAHDPARA